MASSGRSLTIQAPQLHQRRDCASVSPPGELAGKEPGQEQASGALEAEGWRYGQSDAGSVLLDELEASSGRSFRDYG
jgi:hypothetical protein